MTAVDLAVIGAGPAGLNCALAARALGMDVTLVEALTLGGQLVNIAELDALAPWTSAATPGWDLAADLAERAHDAGVAIEFATVGEVVDAGGGWRAAGVGLDLWARAVVMANGTTARPLGLPGADRLSGRGVSACAACDGPLFTGQVVAVIGGGDVARWEATHLASHAARVVVLAPAVAWRHDGPLPANVAVLEGAQLVAVEGTAAVESVRYADRAGASHDLAVAAVFNATDRRPSPPIVAGLKLDEQGAVCVDDALATSAARVYAAGDIRAGADGRVSGALADGAHAATVAAAKADA